MISNKLENFLYNQKCKEQIRQLVGRLYDANKSEEPVLIYGSSPNKEVVYDFIVSEYGKRIKVCESKELSSNDIAGLLLEISEHDIILLNNVELLNNSTEEYLIDSVKNGCVEICIDNASSRTIKLDIPHFTLIGISNHPQTLSDNLKKLFHSSQCIDYSIQETDSVKDAWNDVLKNACETSFLNFSSEIRVPVGLSETSIHDFYFDSISHPHAFIIGQSGSGKSILLHNVISGMILRYAPEDLQLYLLDFKMGGVEFNRYRSLKHVKALLVDNSDIRITLEILRDIDSQMKERGKLLRDAGVSNINDYNKTNMGNRMPAIVLVADECHVMFSTQDSKSRRVQVEINNIITKIAKEGRSQGVHLLLATQTLAGTDISNEVMNNITDHYLLKCSPSDSEKMASNSSSITFGLSTGQVYYHHTDNQHQFKAFYSSKEELADIVSKAEQKSENNVSNGQFYFSGAQIFNIDEEVIQYVGTKGRRNPVVAVGRGISLDESPISITLKQDFSENILVFGLNDDEQVTRTTLNILMTLASSNIQKDLDIDFIVFDCLNNDEGRYVEALDELEAKGICKIVSGRKRGALLKQLVKQISSDTANPTALFILGQERFRELKMDMPLEEENSEMSGGGLMAGLSFGNEKPQAKTYQEAMRFILERGPECGVHTILQIDKPDKLLFSEYSVTSKDVFKMFKHLIMLRSDENAATRIVDNEIRLENLSGDNERLRAFYYSEEEDRYTLLTPYEMPTKEDVNKFFN